MLVRAVTTIVWGPMTHTRSAGQYIDLENRAAGGHLKPNGKKLGAYYAMALRFLLNTLIRPIQNCHRRHSHKFVVTCVLAAL